MFYCVALLSIFSKDIVLLLTNESYIEAAKYAPILAYYYAFYILKETADIGVNVTKKPQYTTYIYFIASILNIVLLYFLTPHPQHQFPNFCLRRQGLENISNKKSYLIFAKNDWTILR